MENDGAGRFSREHSVLDEFCAFGVFYAIAVIFLVLNSVLCGGYLFGCCELIFFRAGRGDSHALFVLLAGEVRTIFSSIFFISLRNLMDMNMVIQKYIYI